MYQQNGTVFVKNGTDIRAILLYDGKDQKRRDIVEICHNIAAVLHRAKEQLGLSMRQFAKKLDISVSTLQKYMSGKEINYCLYTIVKLAGKLDVSVESLIAGTAFSDEAALEMWSPICGRQTRTHAKLRRRASSRFYQRFPWNGDDVNA